MNPDKIRIDAKKLRKTVIAAVQKYKYILAVILAGVVLLALPKGGEGGSKKAAEGEQAAALGEFDLQEMEHRLEQILSQVQGAGETRVILTVRGSPRQVLAQDGKRSERENSTSTVVLSKGSGTQTTAVLQELYPQYQGALVVCPGGDDPLVRLELSQAISALTGLGSDKISICKSK